MDLGRLRRIIDGLIEEQGADCPVAVFYITTRDVQETLEFLQSSGKIRSDFCIDPRKVLTELQSNAGNPPFDDQLLKNLEDLLIHWEDSEG